MDKSRRYRNTPQLEASLREKVRELGFAITALIPDPPREPVGWTYTVGMTRHGLPELVIADMPGQRAGLYLQNLGRAVLGSKVVLRPGASVRMHDASVWRVKAQHPRATAYGVHWAMRLYGERRTVQAVAVVPPPSLATRPGERWAGYLCQCGCQGGLDPLAGAREHVGSVYLR